MFERLRNNLGLKVLALAIAIGVWVYLRLAPNPVIAARFVQQMTVPITTTGLRPDAVARYSEHTATVAVVIPRDGLSLKAGALRAVLELDDRPPGVYNLPLQVIAPKLEIQSLSPASVTLAIVQVATRNVPLGLRYLGASHGLVVQHAELSPSTVSLRGPSDDLARVASVVVDLPFPTQASLVDAMIRPIPTGSSGGEIGAIAVSPNLIRVRASFVVPGAKH
ncbi:MAG: CdaR family protein [Vulcanimicrobiaceae bacterium]